MDMSRQQAAEISCRLAADAVHYNDSKPLPAVPCEICLFIVVTVVSDYV